MGRLPFWSPAQQRHPHLVAQGNYRESQSSSVLCQEQEVPTAVGASECAVLAVSTATAPESQPDTQGCLHPCPCQAPRDRNCSSSTCGNRNLVKAILSAAATAAPSGSNNQTQDQVQSPELDQPFGSDTHIQIDCFEILTKYSLKGWIVWTHIRLRNAFSPSEDKNHESWFSLTLNFCNVRSFIELNSLSF